MHRNPLAGLLCLGGILVAISSAGAADPPDPEPQSWIEENVLVRRVHVPVFIEPTKKARRHPERCAELSPAEIVVTEDGAPVKVTAVDETLHGTLHAILIDTSASMRTRLDRAKQAALRYVESLDPDEQVLVASFDDNLILRSPPTTDRERASAAVRSLEVGNNTALWDALHYLIRYLEPYREQKVIVLLSDGEDSASLRSHDYPDIIRSAVATPNLTIFPIGLDLPTRSDIDGPDRRVILGELARTTGGSFYEVKRVARLSDAFQRIQRRLHGKSFVTYVPRPFGEGPLDEPGSREFRWRRVEIRAVAGVPCRVISLAPPLRLEGRSESAAAPVEITDAYETPAAPSEETCFDPGRYRVRAGIVVPSRAVKGEGDSPTELWALEPPETLLGRASDIVMERSFLYDARFYARSGKLRLRMNHKPTFAQRAFAVDVPPLDELRRTLFEPEDVILRLLERPSCPPVSAAERAREPVWVHGQTFLEVREAVGLALFRFHPDYGEWATRRLRQDGAPEIDALLLELQRSRNATPEELERAGSALDARAADPDRNQPQRYLAEWLGDVTARDLAVGVEHRAAAAMLEGEGGGLPELTRTVLDRWEDLCEWLPPPTRVRVLTPLVPAYDPDRDVIGFYRILLPVARVGGDPVDQVPTAPYGVLALRWLLEEAGIGDHIPGGLRLASLSDETISPTQSRRLVRAAGEDDHDFSVRPRPVRRVGLELATATAADDVLSVTVYVAGDPDLLGPDAGVQGGPYCIAVAARNLDGELRELAVALTTLVDRDRLSCPRIQK